MKKNYITPEINATVIISKDIITQSGTLTVDENGTIYGDTVNASDLLS